MEIFKGKNGLSHTQQNNFPETTECSSCGGSCRIAFVAHEDYDSLNTLICDLHKNLPKQRWPHDLISVAIYFCSKCLNCVSLFNQG